MPVLRSFTTGPGGAGSARWPRADESPTRWDAIAHRAPDRIVFDQLPARPQDVAVDGRGLRVRASRLVVAHRAHCGRS
ncbi:hypothetical protein GCM10018987_54920 [Streptomyces cremeus]